MNANTTAFTMETVFGRQVAETVFMGLEIIGSLPLLLIHISKLKRRCWFPETERGFHGSIFFSLNPSETDYVLASSCRKDFAFPNMKWEAKEVRPAWEDRHYNL